LAQYLLNADELRASSYDSDDDYKANHLHNILKTAQGANDQNRDEARVNKG